jgi:RimJ/RimL family protein N-acetyltransferase
VPRLVAPVVAPGRLAATDQPVVVGDAVTLRPWRDGDVDAVVDAFGDERIQRWHVRRLDRAEAASWIADWRARWAAEADASWAIIEPGSDEASGYVAIRAISLDSGYGQISYWVRPGFRRRGVATAAVTTAARWAFEDVGLHRIEIRHSVQNPESCGVALRAAFVYEGVARAALLHADGWHDMHVHARIASEDTRARRAGRPPDGSSAGPTMTASKEDSP